MSVGPEDAEGEVDRASSTVISSRLVVEEKIFQDSENIRKTAE